MITLANPEWRRRNLPTDFEPIGLQTVRSRENWLTNRGRAVSIALTEFPSVDPLGAIANAVFTSSKNSNGDAHCTLDELNNGAFPSAGAFIDSKIS